MIHSSAFYSSASYYADTDTVGEVVRQFRYISNYLKQRMHCLTSVYYNKTHNAFISYKIVYSINAVYLYQYVFHISAADAVKPNDTSNSWKDTMTNCLLANAYPLSPSTAKQITESSTPQLWTSLMRAQTVFSITEKYSGKQRSTYLKLMYNIRHSFIYFWMKSKSNSSNLPWLTNI